MKKIIRLFSLILVVALSFTFFSCGSKELTEEEKALLQSRRETVVEYMRKQTDFIWRAGDDTFAYTTRSGITPDEDTDSTRHEIRKGELYRGMPYTYAGGTYDAFMEYETSVGEDGIPVISGLNWQILSGSPHYGFDCARIGNDCSTAVVLAWSQVGATYLNEYANTKYMCVDNGYLRVGDYESNPASIIDNDSNTTSICYQNGEERMYKAYAELQMGDALVTRSQNKGHVIMVTENHVVYDPEGNVDPYESYVVFLEQTQSKINVNYSYFDDELGEKVNVFTGVDESMNYAMIFNDKCLPITCKELIDPKATPELSVVDSIKDYTKENIFEGVINTNQFIDSVYVTISDTNGNVIQKVAGRARRYEYTKYDLSLFITEKPEHLLGKVDLNLLQSGTYNCKTTVKLVTGKVVTVRDFNFNV